MIVLFVHLVLLIFGLVGGICVVSAIIYGTPSSVKNYSVLLLWGAFNDILSISSDLMNLERCTILLPSCFFIPAGPCTKISPHLCNFLNSLFETTVTQSVIIQCVSFWYRLRILRKEPPTTTMLNLIVIICLLPTTAHLFFYNHIKSLSIGHPALTEAVQTLYPQENWTGVIIYGITDINNPWQYASWIFLITLQPALFAYLIVVRYRVVRELNYRKSMSDKSFAMHRVFLKILTIHAILPLTTIIAIASLVLIIFGFVNPTLEELIYIVGSFPPMVMPAITIYFMRPYREFLARHIFCIRIGSLIYPSFSASSTSFTLPNSNLTTTEQ